MLPSRRSQLVCPRRFRHYIRGACRTGPRMAGRSSKRPRLVCNSEIRGKNVLVVGASRGIGFEFVRQLALKENLVHGTVRGEGREDLQQLQRKHNNISVGHLDVSDPGAIKAWAEQLGKDSRQQPFDYAIYIAGVVDDWADLDEVDEARMLHCFKVNTIGALLTAQSLVGNGLLKRGSVLANMTSKMGSLADNSSGGSYAYRASKAAVNQVTKSLSIDLADSGISVALLHPGFVRTDMTRHSGLIDVDESVAGLITVLESDMPLTGCWYDYKGEQIPW